MESFHFLSRDSKTTWHVIYNQQMDILQTNSTKKHVCIQTLSTTFSAFSIMSIIIVISVNEAQKISHVSVKVELSLRNHFSTKDSSNLLNTSGHVHRSICFHFWRVKVLSLPEKLSSCSALKVVLKFLLTNI